MLLAIGMTFVLTAVQPSVSPTHRRRLLAATISAPETYSLSDQSPKTSPGGQDQPQEDSTPNASEDNRLLVGPEGGSTSAQGQLDSQPATEAESTGVVLIETELGYRQSEAAGTGIIVDSEGTILTNNHVIADSTSFCVTIATSGQTFEDTVIGTDSTEDVAVVQIDPHHTS